MNKLDERYQEAYLRELCQFIKIPSRSTPQGGEEGELQRLIEQKMKVLGARVRTFEPKDVPGFFEHPLCCGPGRQYADRPTVIAEIGPADAPALLVLAHSDTVPINQPGEWSFDPFCGEIRHGKILGLGAADDKWGSAALITILRALMESKRPLKKKIILASTIDEENGVGNGLLLLALAGIKADMALYLDGLRMDVLLGNLGGTFLFLKPKAPVEPALFKRHANALSAGSRTLSLERAPLFEGLMYQDNIKRESSVAVLEWENEKGPCFNINFYTLPGENGQAVCAELEAMARKALGKDLRLYETSYLHPWFEPALVSPETPIAKCLAAAVEETLGRPARITTLSKQDAFVLTNHAQIPTVSFGPLGCVQGRGSFHNPDEALTVTEAWDGCRIAYQAVLKWLDLK